MQFDLNPEQLEAVQFVGRPQLILAGAGSGKTRVLTYKVAHLITQKKVRPENILMVTFTNKAAAEMRTRLIKLLPAQYELPLAGTFHSVAAKILRRQGKFIGLSPDFVIYDEADQKDTVKTAMEHLDISVKLYHPGAILATISQAKNELVTATEYQNLARGQFQTTTSRVYFEYQTLLKEFHALDFDDLLMETVRLFKTQPDILHLYQDQFRYVLVDEYQDTNTAQYTLTQLLVSPHQNLTVVGDASQSIYAWRGANFQNIVNFQKDFTRTKVFRLEQNYRSTKNILAAANSVISQNSSHPILTLWTKNGTGSPVNIYEARSELDEAAFIVSHISQFQSRLSDIAVLYRTNAQSRVLEEALLHAGLPYRLVGGVRFYDRQEIKDLLAYLRFLFNPNDAVSQKRIAKLGVNRRKQFLKLLEDKTLVNRSPIEILDLFLEQISYLNLYSKNTAEDRERLENIKELRSVAENFSTLTEFLENVALVEAEYFPDGLTTKDTTLTAVTLMTMHAAKGLEFDTVFMVGMEEGLFPHSRSLLDSQELEEERRLCYVGMTRAKRELFLLHARRRLYFGERVANQVSRFIADIPEELLQSVAADIDLI